MNKEDIEHMWKVASNNPNHDTNWFDPVVIRFAELVASAEREACAKVCDELKITGLMLDAYSCNDARYKCAEAIRARGEA